jgi:hypothetical protein
MAGVQNTDTGVPANTKSMKRQYPIDIYEIPDWWVPTISESIPAGIFTFLVWQIGPRFKIEHDMEV